MAVAVIGSGLVSVTQGCRPVIFLRVFALPRQRVAHQTSDVAHARILDAEWTNSRCGAALIGVLPFREPQAALARTRRTPRPG